MKINETRLKRGKRETFPPTRHIILPLLPSNFIAQPLLAYEISQTPGVVIQTIICRGYYAL